MELNQTSYPQIVEYGNFPINDKCKVHVLCECGNIAEISTRSLVRKWNNRNYQCKSCHTKTYANDPSKLAKFKKSFSKVTGNKHSAKCSVAAKKAWQNDQYKDRMSKLLQHRNKTDQRIISGRKKALKAFLATNYKSHLAKIRTNQQHNKSILESIFSKILTDYNISFKEQFQIGYYIYDFYVPLHNLLIEINGDYWHKNTVAKDSAKATYAYNLGYDFKTIWEHEFSELHRVENLVKQWLFIDDVIQVQFSFKDIKIERIDNKIARIFYGKYHYLPSISKSGYHIAAFCNDEIIASASFSGIIRKQSADRLNLTSNHIRELSRLCIHPAYHKKNFASWFLSKAVRQFLSENKDINTLIAFADTTLHEGIVYKASNWTYDGKTACNYMYKSSDGYSIHKKTLWDNAKKNNMTESEYANKYKYIKIWSKPKNRFIYHVGGSNANN